MPFCAVLMLLTLMCAVPASRSKPPAASQPAVESSEEEEEEGNEGRWRERLAALYAPRALDQGESTSGDESEDERHLG